MSQYEGPKLRRCHYALCERATEREVGSCIFCCNHYCHEHARAPFHWCLTMDKCADEHDLCQREEKHKRLLACLIQIDAPRLISFASERRYGKRCRIPAFEKDKQGKFSVSELVRQTDEQYCNFDIRFEDGVVWLARIPLDSVFLPPEPAKTYIFLSEVYTLKFLEGVDIPTPKVLHYEVRSAANPVGVPFMLIDKLPGTPVVWESLSSDQRTKVMAQLADVYLTLEKYPFDTTGSLRCSPTPGQVGSFALPRLFYNPERSLGPFDTVLESLVAMTKLHKNMIQRGELTTHPVDNYLSLCWREDMKYEVQKRQDGNKFFLRPSQDMGNHILVDDDFNITGLVDWQCTTVEPKALAFSSPRMLWPMDDFLKGKNRMSQEEEEFASIFERRERTDLARLVRRGRSMQRLFYFAREKLPRDVGQFRAMSQGMRAAWIERPISYHQWRLEALVWYERDEFLMRLLFANIDILDPLQKDTRLRMFAADPQHAVRGYLRTPIRI